MAKARQYDKDFKIQAVKLSKEIGSTKAAKELDIPSNTLYGWIRAFREGRLDDAARSPEGVFKTAIVYYSKHHGNTKKLPISYGLILMA